MAQESNKVQKNRLNADDEFRFNCGKGVDCFTKCCGNVMIFLTPYDIVRMKNRLGISSGEFLDKYTISPFYKDLRLPVRLLKMNDDPGKRCPFVSEDGCLIYEDRPWPCRMYPVTAESETRDDGSIDDYHDLLRESHCHGFESKDACVFTLTQWLDDQGIGEFDEMDLLFRDVTMHPFFKAGGVLVEQKMDMFHTAAYDIDKFRRFVFESKFLKLYEVDGETLEAIKNDDTALLKFAFRWLRFSMFGDNTITPRQEALEEFKKGTTEAEQDPPPKKEDGWFKKK